jgi:hypothetical protein
MFTYIKKNPDQFLKIGLTIFFLLIGIHSCISLNKWLKKEDDWIGEELMEEAIRMRTGIDFDLTPSTPEKDR